MGKKRTSTTIKQGSLAFDLFYQNEYSERWEFLKKALLEDSDPMMLNFSDNNEYVPYYLDSASVFASYSLPLSDSHDVLDMCAAPGGKSLVLCKRMNQDSFLISNEKSKERYQRLRKVISECLPEQIKNRVRTTCFDGATWCKYETAKYDSILLDAPCSSEKHVLNNPVYLEKWTSARIKTLAITQWALISSAIRLLKKNGFLLYSTCALSHKENDLIIKRAIEKYTDLCILDIDFKEINNMIYKDFGKISDIEPEKTLYGYHILPDKNHQAGPIFFSLLRKQ